MTGPQAEGVSQREYARLRGVSHKAVQKAIAAGRISTLEGGRLDPGVADREWIQNTDTSKPRNTVDGSIRANALETAAGDGSQPRVPSYATSRAIRELYAAKLAKLEYDVRSGQLLARGPAVRLCAKIGRNLRDGLMNIPPRLAKRLAGCPDADECQEMLEKEMEFVLVALLRGLAQVGGRESADPATVD